MQTNVSSCQKGCCSCLNYRVQLKQKGGRAEEKRTENRQRQKERETKYKKFMEDKRGEKIGSKHSERELEKMTI